MLICVNGMMECLDGVVLYEWCFVGYGFVWCLWWEVGEDIVVGWFVSVFDVFVVLLIGIYVVFL